MREIAEAVKVSAYVVPRMAANENPKLLHAYLSGRSDVTCVTLKIGRTLRFGLDYRPVKGDDLATLSMVNWALGVMLPPLTLLALGACPEKCRKSVNTGMLVTK